jgi:hypothetical protein
MGMHHLRIRKENEFSRQRRLRWRPLIFHFVAWSSSTCSRKILQEQKEHKQRLTLPQQSGQDP